MQDVQETRKQQDCRHRRAPDGAKQAVEEVPADPAEAGPFPSGDAEKEIQPGRPDVPQKAQKMTERSIDAGTDIEDAKEALQSNKEYFQTQYNKLLKEAQERADAYKADQKKQADKLKESILKDKTLLGDMEISNDLRKKVFESISKPVYKDPDTGEYLTSIQKYEMEHCAEFLKYVGLFYTLTNGFKDFDSLSRGKVKKEVRKGLRELEKTLNSTKRDAHGNLRMVTNVREDPESFIGGNFKLAL